MVLKVVPSDQIAVVPFTFGAPSEIGPNQFLANAAKRLVEHGEASKILTQREIGLGYMSDSVVEYISDKPSAEPTLRIAEWVVRRAIESGHRTLIVVAADPHIRRCLRDIKYVVKRSGAGILVMDYRHYPEEIIGDHQSVSWYYPESAQLRTRSPLAWWMREGLLRLIQLISMRLYAEIAG